MADIEVTSSCPEGYTVESVINGEWEMVIDALSEDGPSPNESLAATYASCYIPALRVAADQTGYDDIGHIEIEVSADLDDDDDLESIDFQISAEADFGDDEAEIIDLADDICHVHSALSEELEASITYESSR